MRADARLGIAAALSLGACWASSPEKMVDLPAEATALHRLNASFNAAIQRQDLAGVTRLYTPDAALLWQNDPRLTGPEIRQAWAQAFGLAGFALHIRSSRIIVAQAGDLALDEGTLELELPGPKGVVKHPGKYLVVWKKLPEGWRILYDVYNTDPPATKAAAATK